MTRIKLLIALYIIGILGTGGGSTKHPISRLDSGISRFISNSEGVLHINRLLGRHFPQSVSGFPENISKISYSNGSNSSDGGGIVIKEFEDMPNDFARRIRNGTYLLFGVLIGLAYLSWKKP